jgi:hypothetical protein
VNKKDIPKLFIKIVDDLILKSGDDTRLAESIRWIDLQSQKNTVGFYEMAYTIVDRQLIKKRAQQWLKCRGGMNHALQ